jgi:hypothetical protein
MANWAVLVGNVDCVKVDTAVLFARETSIPLSKANVVSPVVIVDVLPVFGEVVGVGVVVGVVPPPPVVPLLGPVQFRVCAVLVQDVPRLAMASS